MIGVRWRSTATARTSDRTNRAEPERRPVKKSALPALNNRSILAAWTVSD